MKKLLISAILAALALSPFTVKAADITAEGDTIVGLPADGDWPDGEAPQYVIDDNVGEDGIARPQDTKYLHFSFDTNAPHGFAVTPTHNDRIVYGLNFTSANDTPARNPTSYEIYGTDAAVPTGGTLADIADGDWVLISSGEIPGFGNKDPEWPTYTTIDEPIAFSNDTAYTHYKVMFPTNAGDWIMQIADCELLDGQPIVDLGVDRVVIQPVNTFEPVADIFDLNSDVADFTYLWECPGASFNGTQNSATPIVTFPADDGDPETNPDSYELTLTVTDEAGFSASDTMNVIVWKESDNMLVAHYKMNDGVIGTTAPDGTEIVDIAGIYADNGIVGTREESDKEPNWVEGWIPGDNAENKALNFTYLNYIEVAGDSNDLNSVVWQATFAAWMKVADYDGNRRILQKGGADDQYRLLAENNGLRFHLSGVGVLDAPRPPAGLWHHVAATYDGESMKMYIDGIPYDDYTIEAYGPINVTTDALFIGTKSKNVAAQYAGDYFKGTIDDVRIYNYALSNDEINSLVEMGENAAPAIISIVAEEELIMSVQNFIEIDSTVMDFNNDTITYTWTCEDESVTFDNFEAADPKAYFSEAGEFVITLTISDGMFDNVSDSITVSVRNPSCEESIAEGHLLMGDFNEDCHIDLLDLAEFAKMWLECNDPQNPECTNPYAAVLEGTPEN